MSTLCVLSIFIMEKGLVYTKAHTCELYTWLLLQTILLYVLIGEAFRDVSWSPNTAYV